MYFSLLVAEPAVPTLNSNCLHMTEGVKGIARGHKNLKVEVNHDSQRATPIKRLKIVLFAFMAGASYYDIAA